MALGCQVIDFVRLHQINDPDQAGRVGQIPVVQGDLVHNVVDTSCIGNRSPASNTVDLISLFQQELSQIGAVLSGDAGDECFFS